jgi:hypothetical protein
MVSEKNDRFTKVAPCGAVLALTFYGLTKAIAGI